MHELREALMALGLTDEEIHLYITSLETGAQTVLELSRKTEIPRTTVYLLIDSLSEKGLLQKVVDGNKKLYVPAQPEELVEIGNKKRRKLDEAIEHINSEVPKLKALYALKHSKPTFQQFEGKEEVNRIYESALEAEKIYIHRMSPQGADMMGGYLETFYEKLSQKMIHTQEIVSDSEADKKYKEERSTSRNQIICIPAAYTTSTDYLIYNETVAFLTCKDAEPVGVVIKDPEIAHFEKVRFLLIWERFAS